MPLYHCTLTKGFQGTIERKRTIREVAEESEGEAAVGAFSNGTPLTDAPAQGDCSKGTALDEDALPLSRSVESGLNDAPSGSAPLASKEVSTSSDSSAELDQSNDVQLDQNDGYRHAKYHERSAETESLLSDVLESASRIYSKHLQGTGLNS